MDNVANLLDRPQQYYNVDGVGELGIGFMCLCFALIMWLQIDSPPTAIWHSVFPVIVFVVLMSRVIKYGSEAIKKRITYPRTGFVEYRKNDRAPLIAGLVAAAVVVALRWHWQPPAPGALFGIAFSALYGYRFAQAMRWKWAVAGVMAFGSLVIAFLPVDRTGGPIMGTFVRYFTLYGAVLLVSGAISLWLYLRHTPAPAPEGR